ncbi:MAG: myo-inositol-1(or 4)-monophosphatase [Pseudohongiellaceae bacterium]
MEKFKASFWFRIICQLCYHRRLATLDRLVLYTLSGLFMHALVNIALRAANDAGEALAHSSERLDKVSVLDSNPDNFVTSLDENANRTILYHLDKAFPTHSIRSRVSGFKQGTDKTTTWLVDPLIGGQNLSRGYPAYGVSIACEINGVISHSVVVCPALREEISASRGKGAQLNSRRIRVNPEPKLGSALFAVNASADSIDTQLAIEKNLVNQGGSIRNCGVTALDLVATAIGRIDGGWAQQQYSVGLAAALLILQEAGGMVANETGNPNIADARELIYASPSVFKQLMKIRGAVR